MKCNKRIGVILFLVLVFIFIGAIIFKTYRVEDHHMASTFLPGDILFCNHQTSNLETDDLVLYHDPTLYDLKLRQKPVHVSRIIGFPGDQINIKDKEVLVNNYWLKPPVKARRAYRVITDGSPIDSAFLSEFHVEDPVVVARKAGIYDLYLDTVSYQALKRLPRIVNVRSTKLFEKDPSSGYWPYSGFYTWNRDQMGPLSIPKSGQTVDLSLDNIDQYRDIIENHEGHELIADFRGIRIDGHPVHSFTFSKNYYFVLDDNRDHPNDSRIAGYIPEDHLVGRVLFTLWSPATNQMLGKIQ